MYVSFPLGSRDFTLAARQARHIEQSVQQWANKHEIRYMLKQIAAEMRLTLACESHYTVFSLTWSDVDHRLIDCKDH